MPRESAELDPVTAARSDRAPAPAADAWQPREGAGRTAEADRLHARAATPEQVLQAWKALTPVDMKRLRDQARLVLAGSGFSDAEELLLEAMHNAWLAAATVARGQKQQGRIWPLDIPFKSFLMNTIRGIASDARRNWYERTILRDGEDHEGQAPEDLLAMLLLAEQHDRALAVMAELQADPRTRDLVNGMAAGLTAEEIRFKAGMTPTQYETAQQTLRRKLARMRAKGDRS